MKPIYYKFSIIFLFLLLAVFTPSCGGDDAGGDSESSVTIYVTDQNNQPVAMAVVTSGDETVTTDTDGKAVLSHAVLQDGLYRIEAEASGYFTNYLNLPRIDGSDQKGMLILLQSNLIGSFNSDTGGVTGPSGMRVHAPANAFHNANGSLYSGTVNVYANYINYNNSALSTAMPGGDFAAVDEIGQIGGMRTSGFVATQFRSPANEVLTPSDDVKIAVTMPAGRSEQLLTGNEKAWCYDPVSGKWNEPEDIETSGSDVYLPVTTLYTNIDAFVQTGTLNGLVECPDGNGAAFVMVTIQSPYSKYITYTNERGKFKAKIEATTGAWTYTVTPVGGGAMTGQAVPANETTSVSLTVSSCSGGTGTGGEGDFTISGSNYSGNCVATPATGTGCTGINVVITNTSGQAFIIYNMPEASSGSFTVTDGYETVGSCQLYILTNEINGTTLASKNGTLVKTSSTSFTITGIFQDIINETTYSYSASGNY